jgi:hypothetical protein
MPNMTPSLQFIDVENESCHKSHLLAKSSLDSTYATS